ncbi:MAG: hypothetical protein ABR964_00380 [Tepidisphaeraceae bacterium]|jgi:hypothetical protein
MQKILQFLEKNVEWLALGLGVLFLGWAAWTYLIIPPVSNVVGGIVMTPGNVDDEIWNTSGERLDTAIKGATPPSFKVDDFPKTVAQGLALPPGQPLPPLVWDFQPAQPGATPGANNVASGPMITQLPVLPPAKPLMVVHGQTTIVPMPAPLATNAPTPAAVAAPSAHKDIHWTTIAFTIPIAPLSDQWTKAFGPNKPGEPWKLPDTQHNTEIIAVTAYRSEKLPGGGWSEEKEVPRLLNNVLQPFPVRRRIDQINFQSWAANHSTDIATPLFPTRAPEPAGTVWKDPLMILQGLMSAVGTPANPAPANPAPAAPRRVVSSGIEGGAGEEDTSTTPTTPTPGMPASSVAVTLMNEPKVDPVRPLPTALPAAPQANLNPAATTTDLLVYLHDDQVTPGKTYRYCIAYMLLNPLFGKPADRAANKAWVDQLDLLSEKSDYSPEVTIEPQTFFYCAAANQPKPGFPFPFDVFTWASGLWQKHTFTVNPGDAIGTVADGVDYSTGCTYVDGRVHSRQFHVTIVDDSGQTSIRRADLDSNSSDHKLKQQWVDQGSPPGNAGAATRPAAKLINEGGDEEPPTSPPRR